MTYSSITHTPLGYMRAITTDIGVCRLDWQQTPFTIQPDQIDNQQNDVSRETISQLNAYLAGKRTKFTLFQNYSQMTKSIKRK